MEEKRPGRGHRGWPACLMVLFLVAGSGPAAAFDLDDVAREAAALARAEYRPPAPADPAAAARRAALSYDEYRNIRYRPERALWRGSGSPFEIQFFPLGRSHVRALRLYEVVQGQVQPVLVRASDFDGPAPPADAEPAAAGWRLSYPLNAAGRLDEVIVFLGASYFRAVGAGQHYGLSARGLALDTVGGSGEEFPAYTSFWFERPQRGAQELTFYALLEGPRVTGAYRYVVHPGPATVVDVQARLYLRGAVATLGLAPLTSMFLMGENQPVADDYRPEVHDSDGLQIQTAQGEWLWRPLTNPSGVFVTSYALRSPRGWGLLQRDRAFDSYEDLEARYERRPGVWVEPLGDWGPGRLELLQFHTPDETHDNIVAYWVPRQPPAPSTALEVAWRLHWVGDGAPGPPGARVVQTRRGHGYREAPIPRQRLQFHLDFAGPGLPPATEESGRAEAAGVVAEFSANDNARDLHATAYPNLVRGGWRVTLEFERIDPRRAVELRAFLRRGSEVLSETWSYALAPD